MIPSRRKEQVSHNFFRDWLVEVSAILVINDKNSECTDLPLDA